MSQNQESISHNIYQIIGRNIKYYRKKKRWTQEQLAQFCHLSYGYIKNLEAEHVYTSISIETLLFIASVLEIDISKLLKDNTDIFSKS